MIESKYFTSHEIMKNVIQITDIFGFCATLVIGTKKALLFDTMCGIGNLKSYVKSMVKVPVVVVLSHGHFDHTGGANLFSEAFIHRLEIKTMRICYEDNCVSLLNDKFQEWKEEHNISNGKEVHGYNTPVNINYSYIEEGHTFELGGIKLEVIELPGHTPGSIGLYCEKNKYILTGDAITPIMCLFFEGSSVITYEETLFKLKSIDFNYFITSHHQCIFSKSKLKEFYDCLLFSQKDKGMKFQYDIIPRYKGRFHIYKGINSEDNDFIGIIHGIKQMT